RYVIARTTPRATGRRPPGRPLALSRRGDLSVSTPETVRPAPDHQAPGQREGEPAAGGHSVDRHDHGLVAPGEARHGPVQVGRELLDERADPREVVGEVLHVTARAERLARAGNDHAAHARVVVDIERGVEKLPPERQVERVERVGPVERDRRDPVTAVEDQRLEIHRSLLRVHRLVSDGGDSITDSPRLRLRLALRPRDVLRLARPLHRLVSDGGAPAPRRPAARTTTITDSPRLRLRLARPRSGPPDAAA